MKRSIILFFVVIFFSCSKGRFYDAEFYERISGIKIPVSAHVLESFDNGEFVTTSTFEINETDLKEFVKQYTFELKDGSNSPHFFGSNHLKGDRPNLHNSKNLYMNFGSKGKNSWLYIVDLKANRLWAEIQYLDMAGD